ncbi:thioredoxin-like protein [Infundibulicybe gibba]|nr:thioredoxin-like protein [Infundibulicybe gibba]
MTTRFYTALLRSRFPPSPLVPPRYVPRYIPSYSNFSTKPHKMSDVQKFVDSAIADNTAVVFSKSWCPYCKKAKKLLSDEYSDVTLTVYELDELTDGDAIQQYLQKKSGQRTVPNIFIKGKHVGGSDDLTQAHKNKKIRELLA